MFICLELPRSFHLIAESLRHGHTKRNTREAILLKDILLKILKGAVHSKEAAILKEEFISLSRVT